MELNKDNNKEINTSQEVEVAEQPTKESNLQNKEEIKEINTENKDAGVEVEQDKTEDEDDRVLKIFEKKMQELENKYKVKENKLILKHTLKEFNIDEDCASFIQVQPTDDEASIRKKVEEEVERINKIVNKWESNKIQDVKIPKTQNTKNSKTIEKKLEDRLLDLFK